MQLAIPEASDWRHLPKFVDRQAAGINIQAGPAIQIVPAAVVKGMLPAPHEIRRERDQAAEHPQNIVGAARSEERAMTAIMLDDEDADEEAGA